VLFRRLAVFAGGFTLEAAAAVCADRSAGSPVARPQVLDLLTGLVDKSLVQVDGRDGVARYRLLETLREYGAERLDEAKEAVALRGRHLAWCVALAERAEAAPAGPEQAAWLGRIERELDNLRAALDWCVRSGTPRAAGGLRVAAALGRCWSPQGQHGAEVRRRLAALLLYGVGFLC
jgi:non-specific serine/threonine protein kinase